MKITVLVSLYRASKYLSSKLENLQQQTIFSDSEIILLNCQNLERESDIYRQFNLHPNVKAIEFPNYINLYAAWNCGIQESDGSYIVNSNVDDLWHPEFLEKCANTLDNNDWSVVSTGIYVTDTANQHWPNWTWLTKMPPYPYPESSAGPCPMWRRKLHDKYGLFSNYRVIGDARMWEQWYAGGEKFGLLDDCLVLYYINPQSLERRRNSTGRLLSDIDLCETK